MPTTRNNFGADTIPSLLWSKVEKMKGIRKRSDSHLLLMGNYNPCLTRLWTVCFQCHGNLQKDLHNDETFLGGLYQLKHCYNKRRIPKTDSLNTRSSTSAIVKCLKFSPENSKTASLTIKTAGSYLTFHQYKTGFPTSALLAASIVKTWKLQEKCISIDSTKQECN